jgi:hypothetical protein
MIRARLISAHEWDKLAQFNLPPTLPYADPGAVDIVVVEDGDKIVASLVVMKVSHIEGLWVDPAVKGNAGVMRALLRLTGAVARRRGESWVMGGASKDSPKMRSFMKRLGGAPIEAEFYALRVRENS